MEKPRLILVLADQLSQKQSALRQARLGFDVVLFAEVAEEANYVLHNRHKLVLLFSAMRHFNAILRASGHKTIYRQLNEGVPTLLASVQAAMSSMEFSHLVICEPSEYRLCSAMAIDWQSELGTRVELLEDDRFLASHADFQKWASDRKQLRMEFFYRQMRSRYNLLIDLGRPAGGKWNYDSENRVGWRSQISIPERPAVTPDEITKQVINEVLAEFPNNPGDLSKFRLAVTADMAEYQFEWFVEHALENFGTYQDALPEASPWVFHSLISMYMNCGLLEPLAVCRRVESAWRSGQCSLAAAEGFIRQVLGWREFVRGIYWLYMPDYKASNALGSDRSLPGWFWDADTDLRCLQMALRQSLDLGYAHHIQRLMVIGNFALLAGLSVSEVCDWYLGVYVDAYEWVELPNTLGMALYADNGLLASKPYAASGKYIQRQGDHCAKCIYTPAKTTGPDACPFNSLYWRFISRHSERLSVNPRMGLILGNWRKREPADQAAIVAWADAWLHERVG